MTIHRIALLPQARPLTDKADEASKADKADPDRLMALVNEGAQISARLYALMTIGPGIWTAAERAEYRAALKAYRELPQAKQNR